MRKTLMAVCVAVLTACGAEQGERGPPGPAGPPGPQGGTGPANTVQSKFVCSHVHNGWLFLYEHVLFASGDAWVKCGIAEGSAEYSTSTLYPRAAVGATAGGCTLFADVDGASYGFWAFEHQGTGVQARYTDSSSANNTTSVTLTAQDCTTYAL